MRYRSISGLVLAYTLVCTSLPIIAANKVGIFRKCLPPFVPLHLRSSSSFSKLKNLSFNTAVRNPLLIVAARSEIQVAFAVRCARRAGLKVCARAGGHSFLGAGVCSGVTVDLGGLRSRAMRGNVAQLGSGLNLGETLWFLRGGSRRRWIASGVCPGVGLAGYTLGGGHGPYEGTLGLLCDSLESLRMVDRFGNARFVSRKNLPSLFWAMCGAGGGQFGIVTRIDIRTASSARYDKAVAFHFRWPRHQAGELLHKWTKYNEENGRVWFRMESRMEVAEPGFHGFGACYNVHSVKKCMQLLKKAPFFQVAGREKMFMAVTRNALDVHAFFGPDGSWGRHLAPNRRSAYLSQRYVDKGKANGRLYRSPFLKRRRNGKSLTPQIWQRFADFCGNPGRNIPWVLCELNLFNNAIDKKKNNAFPHRGADVITHFIIGGGSKQDQVYAYRWMKRLFKSFTTGVYVNYPETQLSTLEYPRMYWGKSLKRLRAIKKRFDPDGMFMNPQPIPIH